MKNFPQPSDISAEEFERLVKTWFDGCSDQYEDYASEHRELVKGMDGEYEIDVTLRFNAFGGAGFLVLCECKKHKNPIKRAAVQILHSRMQSIGAHKGILVSTTSFQSGAKEFADHHGIALVTVQSGSFAYIQNSKGTLPNISDDADDFVGFSVTKISSTDIHYHLLKKNGSTFLDRYFEKGTFISDRKKRNEVAEAL